MGCFQGKVDWNEFETCMELSCQKLGLGNLNCEEISNIFHRYTLHFHLTQLQLHESLKELQIELTPELQQIFNFFLECPKYSKIVQRQNLKAEYKKDYYKNLYSVKRLSTFSIILGRGRINEKFRLLFLTYDIDASNYLSKWEITSLITDIIEISLEIIPEVGKIFFPTKDIVINKQVENLVAMKQNFIDYFRYLILEDHYKEISCQDFLRIMHQQDLKFILNHKSLRSFIMNNFKQCQKEFEGIKKEDEDFETEREQYLQYNQKRRLTKKALLRLRYKEMAKKTPYGLKRHHKQELEDSFDTSWLSSSITSPNLVKPKLDLSNIMRHSDYPSNRTSISINQSFEDMSFFRSELSTPRIVRASHDVSTLNSSRAQTNRSFFRTKPRVVTIKNRTFAENILLDVHPKNIR